ADRNRSHWSTSKTPSYTKSVSWQHHHLGVLGLTLDVEMNKQPNSHGERIISANPSQVICAVIPTNEEKMIALDAIHLGNVKAPVEFA
ncbi:hypothetical protein NP209_21590, partial [Salmonella enterica]|nr:hypothetical protein [Salmonella enterica]